MVGIAILRGPPTFASAGTARVHRCRLYHVPGARIFTLLLLVGLIVGEMAPCLANSAVDPNPLPPPVVAGVGQSGYDLITGSFSCSATEVVIGQPNAGWRDNYAGTINSSDSITCVVSLGGNLESFRLAGGAFTSNQPVGSTLHDTVHAGSQVPIRSFLGLLAKRAASLPLP